MWPTPPLAPKIISFSPDSRWSVSSSPRSAVMPAAPRRMSTSLALGRGTGNDLISSTWGPPNLSKAAALIICGTEVFIADLLCSPPTEESKHVTAETELDERLYRGTGADCPLDHTARARTLRLSQANRPRFEDPSGFMDGGDALLRQGTIFSS